MKEAAKRHVNLEELFIGVGQVCLPAGRVYPDRQRITSNLFVK